MAICPNCFERIEVSANVCKACGKTLGQEHTPQETPKRRITPVITEPHEAPSQTAKRPNTDPFLSRLAPFGNLICFNYRTFSWRALPPCMLASMLIWVSI